MADERRELAKKYRKAQNFLDAMGAPDEPQGLDVQTRFAQLLVDIARGDRLISVDLVRKALKAKPGEKI